MNDGLSAVPFMPLLIAESKEIIDSQGTSLFEFSIIKK